MLLQEPTPPSADILTLPQEDWIQHAINAITNAGLKPNGDQQLLICKAAETYDVPRTTLCSHMKGLCTRAEAHMEQQALSPAEEEVLVKWAKVQGRHGIPLTYSTLTKYASEISGKLIEKSWPKHFLARHQTSKSRQPQVLKSAGQRLSIRQLLMGSMISWKTLWQSLALRRRIHGTWMRRECNWAYARKQAQSPIR